ncbi:Uncharacterised protein [Vibrio cholerae]|nr:Uncharacterised protein [Vibrio cholerae]CSI72696.1 Uncharacterised protein [Vibrio cholerae]
MLARIRAWLFQDRGYQYPAPSVDVTILALILRALSASGDDPPSPSLKDTSGS